MMPAKSRRLRCDKKVRCMKIILLGPQGSGKGTQARLLSERYGIPHISTGDIFRAAVASGSELGNKVKVLIDAGKMMPNELTIRIVRERLSQKDCAEGYLLDGFPRTLPQAEALQSFSQPEIALDIEIEDKITIKRLSSRLQCRKCGAIYGAANPPKKKGICDKDGGELYQREDDMPVAIKKRLADYHAKTRPLTDYYQEQRILLKVDGSQHVEKVFNEIVEKISER